MLRAAFIQFFFQKMTTTHNETLPNEFWKHLGKFNLSEYSEPRWSILVNDMGLQVIFELTNFIKRGRITWHK